VFEKNAQNHPKWFPVSLEVFMHSKRKERKTITTTRENKGNMLFLWFVPHCYTVFFSPKRDIIKDIRCAVIRKRMRSNQGFMTFFYKYVCVRCMSMLVSATWARKKKMRALHFKCKQGTSFCSVSLKRWININARFLSLFLSWQVCIWTWSLWSYWILYVRWSWV
jgi:hypothetical protein